MKHFMDFGETLKALHKGLITEDDLRDASFAFNCGREYLFVDGRTTNGPTIPVEVAATLNEGMRWGFCARGHVFRTECEMESLYAWDRLMYSHIEPADAAGRVVYRVADFYQYALEPLHRGNQVWFGEHWLTLGEVEHHLGIATKAALDHQLAADLRAMEAELNDLPLVGLDEEPHEAIAKHLEGHYNDV